MITNYVEYITEISNNDLKRITHQGWYVGKVIKKNVSIKGHFSSNFGVVVIKLLSIGNRQSYPDSYGNFEGVYLSPEELKGEPYQCTLALKSRSPKKKTQEPTEDEIKFMEMKLSTRRFDL